MKQHLSSFDIYVITSDLQELIGYSIDKIYHLTRNELLIKVKNNKTRQKQSIYIKNGGFLCTTEKKIDTPLKPTTFAMTLRKYLLNGRINEITQYEFDRIIKINIGKKQGEYTLVIEFFSKGNIILVDPDNKIILPLIKQHWAHRSIKSKEQYIPPPAQINPFNLKKNDFIKLLKESKADLVRTLAVNINLSGPIAEEICVRADINKKTEIKELDNKSIDHLYNILIDFIELFKNNKFNPGFIKKEGENIDVLPFEFISYDKWSFEPTKCYTKALEEFIEIKKTNERKDSKIENEISKLQRQLIQQKETVINLENKISTKKLEGDLIYLNFQQCETLIDEITEILQQKEKDEKINDINNRDIVKEFDPVSNRLAVLLKNTNDEVFEVKLDFRISAAKNAEKAYNYNKKLRSKQVGAKESIEKTKKLIESAEKKNIMEKKIERKKTVYGKTFWFDRFRWFISSDGNIVICGKDAKSNEQAVKKYLKAGDRYAHADIHGAPSCIIKSKDTNDKVLTISEETLEEACQFASIYSKAWKQFAETQAYWVLPEQVSKTPASGEYLSKGAFIIRGKRNYYRCKMEIAIGEIKVNDSKRIIGGPISAVKKRAEKYIILVPGDMKNNVISHKLSKIFNVSTDQIDRVLPPGGTGIIKTVGFDLNKQDADL